MRRMNVYVLSFQDDQAFPKCPIRCPINFSLSFFLSNHSTAEFSWPFELHNPSLTDKTKVYRTLVEQSLICFLPDRARRSATSRASVGRLAESQPHQL